MHQHLFNGQTPTTYLLDDQEMTAYTNFMSDTLRGALKTESLLA